MLIKVAKIIIGFLLLIACFFGFIDARDRWREDHIQANKSRGTIGMSEAEVISILGEPTSRAMIDTPAFTAATAAIPGNNGNQATSTTEPRPYCILITCPAAGATSSDSTKFVLLLPRYSKFNLVQLDRFARGNLSYEQTGLV
ncbi:MAG: hypothetical protein IPG22_18970 [Acidobacteria bacterium]|nr:hypothetical protein [Acidobacteriota bacterium]